MKKIIIVLFLLLLPTIAISKPNPTDKVAQFNLGNNYANGKGVTQDYKKLMSNAEINQAQALVKQLLTNKEKIYN